MTDRKFLSVINMGTIWTYTLFYRFRYIEAFSSKIACFPTQPLFDAPCGGTPCDINVITAEKYFNGLQSRR